MPLFKLQLRGQLGLSKRIASLSPGPFLVEAPSERAARALVDENFGGFCPRDQDGRKQSPVWLNENATHCTALDDGAGGDAASAMASRNELSGQSVVASWLLDTPVKMQDGQQPARMLWWPVDPDDACPT